MFVTVTFIPSILTVLVLLGFDFFILVAMFRKTRTPFTALRYSLFSLLYSL